METAPIEGRTTIGLIESNRVQTTTRPDCSGGSFWQIVLAGRAGLNAANGARYCIARDLAVQRICARLIPHGMQSCSKAHNHGVALDGIAGYLSGAMATLLYVDQIKRRFGRQTALHGLRFHLARGEVLGLLGPNGAGKSTALRILSGNLAPSSGRVQVSGIDLARHPAKAKARLGYLPEQSPIYPSMTVDEYLRFAGRLRGLQAAALSYAIDRVKALCGLGQVGQQLTKQLSKGYRQRLGIAQALIHQPDLVILDEPGDGLDPVQTRELRVLINEVASDAGVILSSHALTEVQACCSRAIILHQGRQLLDTELVGHSSVAPELQIRLHPPAALSSLQGLKPVASAEVIAPGCAQVRLKTGATPEMLSQAVIEHGYGLVELRPCRTNLEQVFFRCIGMESAA